MPNGIPYCQVARFHTHRGRYLHCMPPGVKKDRIQDIAKYWLENGKARPENRGGSKKNEEHTTKKDMVRKHIQSFNCRAMVHLGESSCGVT
ncbi:hypothetical protein QQF64_029830 [Cirrhinus molitorella]|uniref:Uncharacterized protein n=1 Tax=Cirrhinus molitorella TaxID=172907 RepID=A0ABR3N1Q7_9TELE